MTDSAIALLRQIAVDVAAIRALLESKRTPVLRHSDREALARILPVIAAHFSDAIACWQIVDAAEQDDALAVNLQLVLDNRTARELGQLFGRAAGEDIDGYLLQREGRDAYGAKWRVLRP